MDATKIECRDCGGNLIQQGPFYVCEFCGSQWKFKQQFDGSDLAYRSIEKKEVTAGKIARRSSQIKVKQTQVKAINTYPRSQALQLSQDERLQLIVTFLESGEWETARAKISQILRENPSCAEARWYKLACDRQVRNSNALIRSFNGIMHRETAEIDAIIQNSTPEFAQTIIDGIFSFGYVGDESTARLFETVYPYMGGLYQVEAWRNKVAFAFDMVIGEGYGKTFDYLLTYALDPNEVDRYIDYLERFAKKCDAKDAQKYYAMILAVDPGNMEAHRNLIYADLRSNAPKKKWAEDLENLLSYAENRDEEIESFISELVKLSVTDKIQSEFMWALLGYHPEGQNGLKQEKFRYANVLLQSEMWKEAAEFYNVVLASDVHNPQAYFGLFLADLQAKSDKEVTAREEPFIENPYYQKALALAKVLGQKEYADYLTELPNQQKGKKADKVRRKAEKTRALWKTIVTVTVVVALLAAVVLWIVIGNSRKYSPDNIEITITDKAYPRDSRGDHFELGVTVENGSTLEIERIDGVIYFYNAEGELLQKGDLWLSGPFQADESYSFKVNVDTEEGGELYNAALHELKITWKLTKLTFTNGKDKEYKNPKEITIHEAGASDKGLSSQEKTDSKTNEKLNQALQVFEDGADDPINVDYSMENAKNEILEILGKDITGESYGPSFEKVYSAATAFYDDRQFGKAYLLFDVLSYYSYEDSAELSALSGDSYTMDFALGVLEAAEEDDYTNINLAMESIRGVYYLGSGDEHFMQMGYDAAVDYMEAGVYWKAYTLFEELSYVNFKDASLKLAECEHYIEN